jgi:hypothetical protein
MMLNPTVLQGYPEFPQFKINQLQATLVGYDQILCIG